LAHLQAANPPLQPHKLENVEEVVEVDDDQGILDLREDFEVRMAQVHAITDSLASAIADLGARIKLRTEEVDRLSKEKESLLNTIAKKKAINKAADDMDQYVTQVNSDIPIFSENLTKGMTSFIRMVTLTARAMPSTVDANAVERTLAAIRTIIGGLATSKSKISGFRDVVKHLPPMTTALNRSKRKMTGALDQLIAELDIGQEMCNKADLALRDLQQ
jgi:hypothetical protein